jgi:transposase
MGIPYANREMAASKRTASEYRQEPECYGLACFSGAPGRCDLQVMECDETSRRSGYTAASYIKVLEEVIPQQYEQGMFFLQDNAKIHTAALTMRWLADNGVALLTIPPYSPDLNGIENIWPRLKENMYKIEPELDAMPKSEATLEHMGINVLPQAWILFQIECLQR